MTLSDRPKLFSQCDPWRRLWDAEQSEFLMDILVVLKNGKTYLVNFVSHYRLGSDLRVDAKSGIEHFADPGLIVLAEDTLENMQVAVNTLEAEGYFNALVPRPPSSIPPKLYPLQE